MEKKYKKLLDELQEKRNLEVGKINVELMINLVMTPELQTKIINLFFNITRINDQIYTLEKLKE